MEPIALIGFAALAVVVAFGIYAWRKGVQKADAEAAFKEFVAKSEASVTRRLDEVKAKIDSKLGK